jgi:hypothetical protein
MALAFVLDEHLRGPMWQAVQTHNARGVHLIDVVRVGDPPDLPLGSVDPDILAWAERERRIVVSRDEGTMKTHLAEHLKAGNHSPGVFLIRKGSALADVAFFLAAAAHASDAVDWQDRYMYIP